MWRAVQPYPNGTCPIQLSSSSSDSLGTLQLPYCLTGRFQLTKELYLCIKYSFDVYFLIRDKRQLFKQFKCYSTHYCKTSKIACWFCPTHYLKYSNIGFAFWNCTLLMEQNSKFKYVTTSFLQHGYIPRICNCVMKTEFQRELQL